jgi:hypothetical protein
MGHLFSWRLKVCSTRLFTGKRHAQLFHSSPSSSTSTSDAEKHVVDHAAARTVNAVFQLASDTPLLIRDSVRP